MIPRDIKTKLTREARLNCRSVNQHVIFLLQGLSEPIRQGKRQAA